MIIHFRIRRCYNNSNLGMMENHFKLVYHLNILDTPNHDQL